SPHELVDPEPNPIDFVEEGVNAEAEEETQFFESSSSVDYDPIEKLDSLIEQTAEHYLDEVIKQVSVTPRRSTINRKIISLLTTSATIVGLIIGLYGISYSISHLPNNTKFLSIDISNLTLQDALQTISVNIDDELNKNIVIESSSDSVVINPAELGLTLDVATTLKQTRLNPFQSFSALIQGYEVTPVIRLNDVLMKAKLTQLAAGSEKKPRLADIDIKDGQIITSRQVNGKKVNWDKTQEAIVASWLREENPFEIVYDAVEPQITDSDVLTLSSQLENYLSGTVIVRSDNRTAIFSRRDIAEVIYFEKNQSKIQMHFNQQLIWNKLISKLPGLDKPIKNADLKIIDETPVLTPANFSLNIGSQEFQDLFIAALSDSKTREIDLNPFIVRPNIETEQLANLQIVEKVSEFRQNFPPAQYRTDNVSNAAKFIDGTILMPGEIYSMNQTIKERTRENGYVPGIYINNGKFDEGLGGGVSIITTAVWTAAFFAGLEPIEQRAHSIYIPRYQEGIEATVQWGSLDLKFKNNLDSAILIKSKVDLDGVTITMYGKKKFDQVVAKKSNRYNVKPYKTIYSQAKNCIDQEGQPGFGVTVTREMFRNGALVASDEFKTNYRIGNTIICGAKPDNLNEDLANESLEPVSLPE
ncbi:MAG: VanW family protein, partial [Candidatus Nanopelagicales bacterium]